MYLIPIHVPIYRSGERCLVTTEWARSLGLLRDSLEDRFGAIHVLAPSLSADADKPDQTLVELTEPTDGIRLIPSFDLNCRARQFWLRERSRWLAQIREALPDADVVHAGMDDVFRPITYTGFLEAARLGKPTVFVQDTDIVLQMRELRSHARLKARAVGLVYCQIFERLCRRGVEMADLSLLKGSTLIDRYGRFAKNPKSFHDTSYSAKEIISEEALEDRGRSLIAGRPVRLVYCGRLIARKGIDHSIRIIKRLRDRGAKVEFDIIGHGPDHPALSGLIDELGLGEVVRLLGSFPYDEALMSRLADYDGLLFTPLAEDTPRMIFDGYAAGLPLIAYEIAYVRERALEDHATLMLPREDQDAAAERILELSRLPERLVELARQARRAGVYHASENWYRRRAEWTFEAVERHGK